MSLAADSPGAVVSTLEVLSLCFVNVPSPELLLYLIFISEQSRASQSPIQDVGVFDAAFVIQF